MRKVIFHLAMAGLLLTLTVNLVGCIDGLGGLFNSDCFVQGALTEDEYQDLPSWQQLLYTENTCNLYVERTAQNTLDDILDLL